MSATLAPRILHAADRPIASAAERARDLGFTHLALSPFGPADQPVRDLRPERAAAALEAARGAGLPVILDLPWYRHAPASPVPADHPGWFDGSTEAGGPAADPRQALVMDDLVLRTDRQEVAGMQADWLAGLIAALVTLGAAGVRLPDLHHAAPDFWRRVLDQLRHAAPDALILGDAIGGPFDALAACDGAGFDYLLDSGAWWDGQADWYMHQRDRLNTPTIGFPRLPEDPGRDLTPQTLLIKIARSLLGAPGLLVPEALLSDGDPHLADRLRQLLDWRARCPWLDRTGPLLRAGRAALVRLPQDGRQAREAVALGEEPDLPAILSVAGGAMPSFSPIADFGGPLLMHGTRETDRLHRAPTAKQSQRRLDTLAGARIGFEAVYPEIDGGRFAAKRIVGDVLEVAADILCDGHEAITACFWLTEAGARTPVRYDMTHRGNDRWAGRAVLRVQGIAKVTLEAWRDVFGTWRGDLLKKRAAGQDVGLELREGADLARRALKDMADKPLTKAEQDLAERLSRALDEAGEAAEPLSAALMSEEVEALMHAHGLRINLTRYDTELHIVVDRRQARFSAWYEMFPRSQSGSPDRHGTFDDVIARLPYVRDLGFDVLYFPPIHPIGQSNRKGRNNSLTAQPGDPGSPYAIGSEEGGHDALHPALGTLEDFDRLVAAAHDHGLEIALDFAIQCSPDHPWLKQHPEWFDWRPDGSIKYAENPPKKYEDIVNVHFYRQAIPSLWFALRDVVLFWCDHGVKLYRVDNPHTKPFPFWEWLIGEVKQRHPDALFLSEAFTRPKVMKRLAKLGFTQSYTYFTWRNSKAELTDYVTELTQTDAREVMNPNFFVNTPDINPKPLQGLSRPAHIARLILAGTLASSYGVYNGLEICESTPLPGKEEYLDSEKYEIRAWDMDRPGHIKEEIRWLNALRRDHPALHNHVGVQFLTVWNDRILWYARFTPDLSDYLLFAVNLGYDEPQAGDCEIPLWDFGLADDAAIEAEDLRTGRRFTWHGKIQHLSLGADPVFAAYRLIPPALPARDALLYADLMSEA